MNHLLVRALAIPAFAGCLLLACGGKTTGNGSPGGSSGGSSSGGTSSGGSSSGSSGGTSSSGASSGGSSGGVVSCVNIDLSTYDLSCQQASDCIFVTSGEVCTDQCNCPQAVVNRSEQGRYDQAIASVNPGTCFCGDPGEPQCLANQCTLGGSVTVDAGVGEAGVCVDIELSTYDQSCKLDTDCTEVTSGVLCTDQCECGGSVINVDGEARYNAAVAPIHGAACPCQSDGNARCVQDHCTLCGFGPNQPPGCPDGG